MLPIRVRQAPQFVKQVFQRESLVRRGRDARRRFKLCYFSCSSYFSYLCCSLDSVSRYVHQPVEVMLFNDLDQPLTEGQLEALRQWPLQITVLPWPKSMGWGARQIASIWKAYAFAADGAADDDLIVRVDSDVFFFNDRIFRAVQHCDADMIGDGHFVDFRYCQGGCYFLRADAVRKVNQWLAVRSIDEELGSAGITVEDMAATHFMKRLDLRVWLTWFMMFPDELRGAAVLDEWRRWKFSCAHFVMKNKSEMLKSYRRLVLSPQEWREFVALTCDEKLVSDSA